MQLKNFPKIEYLSAIELVKREGTHSRLNFTAAIAESGGDDQFLDRVGKNIALMLDERTTIFHGRVESVEVERGFSALRVHVKCVSLSIATDEKPKTRIFCNPDKTIADVLDKSKLKLESCGLRLANEVSAQKCERVLLQNQETNFEFIARLAKNFNSRLWVLDTMSEPEIFLSKCVETSARQIKINRQLTVRRARSEGRAKMFLSSHAYFELGSVVTVETESKDATQYVIVELRAELSKESCVFAYELDELKPNPPIENIAPNLEKTVRLHAVVKNVDDPKHLGRIQVQFDDAFIKKAA